MSQQTTLLGLLPEDAVRVAADADDWRVAVRLAGDGLVAAGTTTDAYTNEMISTVEDLGPYIVIAPGLALAHSRPSAAVLRTGLSWVSLRTAVAFGHEQNDPVRLVVGLAATDHAQHTAALGQLAQLLGDEARFNQLAAAGDADTVRNLIRQFESEVPS